ncbi:MAG: hypothetical protein LBE21_06650, partial [Pseudomonadales bacterium]|nr:hypothetical protein [Pseudomonadales bacterium]
MFRFLSPALSPTLFPRAAACLLVLLLGACSFPGVYRIDIQQGNIITQEMVDQLRPGLSKNQV